MAPFKYRPRATESLDKRATQQAGNFQGFIRDDIKTYSPKKGDNWIRILPPTWEPAEHYGIDVHAHYQVGPDKAAVICNLRQHGNRCPVCEARVRAEASGARDEELRDLSPSKRVCVWMLDMKDEAKGPQVWTMPWTVDRDIAKICKDKRSGFTYLIDDPDEGYDVYFDREGESLTTKYVGYQLARRPTSIDPAHIDFIVENPIPSVLVERSYDEVRHLFTGGADEDGGHPPSRASSREPARDQRGPERDHRSDRDSPRGRDRDDRDLRSARDEDADRPPPKRQTLPPRDAEHDREVERRVVNGRHTEPEEDEIPRNGGYVAERGRDRDPPGSTRRELPPHNEDDRSPPRRGSSPRDDDVERQDTRPGRDRRDDPPFDPGPSTPSSSGVERAASLRERFAAQRGTR